MRRFFKAYDTLKQHELGCDASNRELHQIINNATPAPVLTQPESVKRSEPGYIQVEGRRKDGRRKKPVYKCTTCFRL